MTGIAMGAQSGGGQPQRPHGCRSVRNAGGRNGQAPTQAPKKGDTRGAEAAGAFCFQYDPTWIGNACRLCPHRRIPPGPHRARRSLGHCWMEGTTPHQQKTEGQTAFEHCPTCGESKSFDASPKGPNPFRIVPGTKHLWSPPILAVRCGMLRRAAACCSKFLHYRW